MLSLSLCNIACVQSFPCRLATLHVCIPCCDETIFQIIANGKGIVFSALLKRVLGCLLPTLTLTLANVRLEVEDQQPIAMLQSLQLTVSMSGVSDLSMQTACTGLCLKVPQPSSQMSMGPSKANLLEVSRLNTVMVRPFLCRTPAWQHLALKVPTSMNEVCNT